MHVLDAEEPAIVEIVRDFVDREVRPVARELEHAQHLSREADRADEAARRLRARDPRAVRRRRACPRRCYALVTEELAAGLDEPGRRDGRAHRRGEADLDASAREEQKERYLPRMATGELRATMALTEPGGGSDLQAMRTVARRDGDGYVVNGSQDVDHQRPPRPGWSRCCARPTRTRSPRTPGISDPAGREGAGLHRLRATCPSSGTRASRAASCPSTTAASPADALLGGVEGQRLRADDARAGDRPDPGRRPGHRRRAARRSTTRCATPRSARASASRSGSTSRSATYLADMAHEDHRRPASCCCTPPTLRLRPSGPTWRRAWPSCSPRRRR